MKITRFARILFLSAAVAAISASAFAGVFVSVTIAPPALPVYVQPACPGDGYIWTPGYWAYGPDGYYWVPGTWVLAPEPGLLWTPGYWGWDGGVYLWHAGYWGPHVGFYGGVNYGYGYVGEGYAGGYWEGRTFYYNRTVNNVNITNVHIYNKTVINNVTVNRVAYNGGPGGINARPSRMQEAAMHERHFEPTRMQMQHQDRARSNRELLASVNHGRPAIAATARPGDFHGRSAVPARAAGAPYHPENRHMDARAMNRNVPRPERNGRAMDRPQENARNMNRPQPNARNMDRPQPRNMDRPMPRGNEGRGNPQMGRPENHGAPRPAAYHNEGNRPQPHESAPRPEHGDHGHKGH